MTKETHKKIRSAIMKALEIGPCWSSEIINYACYGMKREYINEVLDALINEGEVNKIRQSRGNNYRYEKAHRHPLDEIYAPLHEMKASPRKVALEDCNFHNSGLSNGSGFSYGVSDYAGMFA